MPKSKKTVSDAKRADLAPFMQDDTHKIHRRSEECFEHCSQAAIFFDSQVDWEQGHSVKALQFAPGKVETKAIREGMIGLLNHTDVNQERRIAEGLGFLPVPKKLALLLNMSVGTGQHRHWGRENNPPVTA